MLFGFPISQKEDRLMLRDLKVWVEQFERDLTRAQMAEASLQEKYQVSCGKLYMVEDFCHD